MHLNFWSTYPVLLRKQHKKVSRKGFKFVFWLFKFVFWFLLILFLTQPSHFILLQEDFILLPKSLSPKAVFPRRQIMTKDIKRLRCEAGTKLPVKVTGAWGAEDDPGNRRECCNLSSTTFMETRNWGNPQCKEDKCRGLKAA